MARLNISIPDALYTRLDGLRDRVNASKVCASALEKELDMVEGAATSTADPGLVSRLIERLQQQQTEHNRWFQRGWQDGETWVLESATLQELKHIDSWSWIEEMSDAGPVQVARELRHVLRQLPGSFEVGRQLLDSEPLRDDIQLKDAYLRGWFGAVKEVWKAAKPRLQSGEPSTQPQPPPSAQQPQSPQSAQPTEPVPQPPPVPPQPPALGY